MISETQASAGRKLLDFFALLRPKQWTKNLIAYAPLVFAAKAHIPHLLESVSLCVIAFCMLSSSIYIINDIVDCEADRLHPKKCKRPIASGKISKQNACIVAALLAPSALLLAFYVRPALLLVFLSYFLLTISYSFWLKQIAILDVLCIAAGFLLRAEAGAVAARVPLSGWFLLCVGLGAIFLALEKRRRELSLLQSKSDSHRNALKAYSPALLDRLESLILPGLLTSYVFYCLQNTVHGQWMMLTIPFVIYGLMRYQQLSCGENHMTGTPEDVLLKDRPIQLAILLWLVTSLAVIYGGIQFLLHASVSFLDSLVR